VTRACAQLWPACSALSTVLFLSTMCHVPLQPPLDYKPLLFALGSAALFGVGVGYFKGADSVRTSCVFPSLSKSNA